LILEKAGKNFEVPRDSELPEQQCSHRMNKSHLQSEDLHGFERRDTVLEGLLEGLLEQVRQEQCNFVPKGEYNFQSNYTTHTLQKGYILQHRDLHPKSVAAKRQSVLEMERLLGQLMVPWLVEVLA